MDKIKISDIETKLTYLNELTGNPVEPWNIPAPFPGGSGEPGTRANVGNYHLSQAYGGFGINRMSNGGGGCTDPIFCGHRPKRECYNLLCAYIRGIENKQANRA
tara:strand:+ start:718 stop:1029 length:312 start_codon:yes stop_codon:yes gene_type:complete